MKNQPLLTRGRQAWIELSATDYDTAVYSSPLLLPVLRRELEIAQEILQLTDVLIEVGCGTGQFCRRLIDQVDRVIGVDISSRMLRELANYLTPKMVLIEGDATRLSSILGSDQNSAEALTQADRRVLACVMNTLGIMHNEVRRAVISEMAVTAGIDGLVFLAVFNAEHFECGVQDFYKLNPGLCGILDSGSVDFDSCELFVQNTGYYSHWFKEDELIDLAITSGLTNVELESSGVGLFVRANGSER